VTDTGVGIAPADLPKLFQEFTQVGGSIYRQGQGFGLGLAISKQLVELHGGHVGADSAPGQGSTFSFSLPVDPSLTAEIVRDSAQDERFWSYLEQQAGERKPVLVCAADSTARRLLTSHLTAYDVTWVCDEDELPQALAAQQPAAVVRIEQPGMTSPGTTPRHDFVQRLQGIPLISCSLPGLTRRPWISSLDDYLVKPISRRKLLDTLRRLNRDVSRVLIVEDEAAMREFLALTISTAYPRSAIRSAENGQRALHFTRELMPDVILLDLTLPDVDGLELAEQLRGLIKGEVTIIAVTARDYPAEQADDEPDEISCIRAGRFSQRELERMLNALLEATSPSGMPASLPAATPSPTERERHA
jgi:CheY-like chemotaxis protein